MNRFLVMLLVLSLICLKATTSTAVAAEDEANTDNAEAAPAKGKADEKKTTGKKAGAEAAGEKKDAKAGADKAAKKVNRSLLPEQIEAIKKQFPKFALLRQQVDDANATLKNLKEISGEKERKKAEKLIPKMEEKLGVLLQKLAKDYEKIAAPYDAEWDKLKDQDGKLIEQIAKIEAKGKKADKPWKEREQISNRLTQLDTIRSGLAAIATVEDDKK